MPTLEDTFMENLLTSIIVINHGHAHGGYTLGIRVAVDYIVNLALDGEFDMFDESVTSLVMHTTWVGSPAGTAQALVNCIGVEMQATGEFKDWEIDKAMSSALDYLATVLKLDPKPMPSGDFVTANGRILKAEEFLGLAGTTMMEEVSAETYEAMKEAEDRGPVEHLH